MTLWHFLVTVNFRLSEMLKMYPSFKETCNIACYFTVLIPLDITVDGELEEKDKYRAMIRETWSKNEELKVITNM